MTKNKNHNTGYYLLYGAASLFAMLPFRILYFLSDLLYVVVYKVVGYRKKVVQKNLRNSFPHKSAKELKDIEKKFYKHLCDYFFETVKTLRISEKEIRRRMIFTNPEVINNLTANGNSCLLSLGHYGNWEWVTSIGLYLSPQVEQGHVYKRLSSAAFDALFLKIRSRFKPQPIEMRSIYRSILTNTKKGKAMVIGFLNDQRPQQYSDEHWMMFLNQETLAQTGMERIASQLGFAIVYLDIKKTKRGHYTGTFSVITENASQEEKFYITEKYQHLLEATINNDPPYYLWSHNKWSWKKKQHQQ